MKRILLAAALALAAGGQALAADLPQPGPPPPRAPATYVPAPVPVFSWTGIYVGINGGYGFGDSNWSTPRLVPTGNFNTDGFLVGGTIGGNYQWGQFVLGIEGDGDWTNLNGTTFGTAVCIGAVAQPRAIGSPRCAAAPAMRSTASWSTGRAAPLSAISKLLRLPALQHSTQIGWTAGGGVEFAFTPNLTAKVEYLYVDLGNQLAPANCSADGTLLPPSRSPRTSSAPASTTSSGNTRRNGRRSRQSPGSKPGAFCLQVPSRRCRGRPCHRCAIVSASSRHRPRAIKL